MAYMRDGDTADLLGQRSWREQLERWLADAAAADVQEPTAMTLATADESGRPSARTVLLKGLDNRGLVFFTNLRSRKGRELAANPRAALVLAWAGQRRQVCVSGDVESVTRAETEAYARSRPRGAQLGAWASRQSEVIVSRAVVEERLVRYERCYSGDDVPVPPFWGGWRVLPITVEFWSGRPDRLHDRCRVRRADGRPGSADDDGWIVERLAP